MPDDARPAPPIGRSGQTTINGKPVTVTWTRRAAKALAERPGPLFVELELYFSCLVKKFVHFRAPTDEYRPCWVNQKLALFFRPVTSTACSWDTAAQLGRQPETAIDTPATRRIAPKRVHLDFKSGDWVGEYFL